MRSNLEPRLNQEVPPIGVTSTVLLREDGRMAYPVVEGIPVLMEPEGLTNTDNAREVNLTDQKYAEAYEEMVHWNEVAAKEAEDIDNSGNYLRLLPILKFLSHQQARFPAPKEIWLDATYNCVCQWEGFAHLGNLTGKRMLQLGGKGTNAIRFLLAGAEEVWLLTPMLGEIWVAWALAHKVGVADRFRAVAAFAEEIPFVDETFDAIYSGGCVHHMFTALALPECARVLKPGGRFAALDPWSTTFYELGIKIFGKREKTIYCRPLTLERVAPLYASFNSVSLSFHGGFFYYLIMALQRLGIQSKMSMVWKFTKLDDLIRNAFPWIWRYGPQVALLGIK